MYYNKYESENLYLSPIDVDDYKIFTKWINDKSLSSGLGTYSKCYGELVEKEFLEMVTKSDTINQYAIIRKDDDVMIGSYSLELVNSISRRYNVGGFIGEKTNRGVGYGTEALNLITKYGFEVLNANSINAKIFSFNKASLRMATKANYKQTGKFSDAYFYDGEYHDEVLFEYLASDYFKTKKSDN